MVEHKEMKLIVAGGRDFNDYFYLQAVLDNLLSKTPYENITLICGEARGADALGKKYALENNIKIESFIPDWDKHGKKAGILRNIEMGDVATHLVAFYDGRSRGTGQMIDYAKKKGLSVRVYKY